MAGSKSAARMAMIASTHNNSVSDIAARFFRAVPVRSDPNRFWQALMSIGQVRSAKLTWAGQPEKTLSGSEFGHA